MQLEITEYGSNDIEKFIIINVYPLTPTPPPLQKNGFPSRQKIFWFGGSKNENLGSAQKPNPLPPHIPLKTNWLVSNHLKI